MGDVVVLDDAHGHHVHQAILVERMMKIDVPAKIGHADGVSVLPDAVDDLAGDVHPVGRLVIGLGFLFGPAETERIQGGDDFSTHAVDIPHDAADSRGRPFDRHDLTGMIVAFVGEDDAVPFSVDFPEIDDASVFDRPYHDVVAGGRQVGLQVGTAALVRAVFAPHGVEEGHFGQGGIAAQDFGHPAGLARRQS